MELVVEIVGMKAFKTVKGQVHACYWINGNGEQKTHYIYRLGFGF